jgi:hypothetical protein
MLSLFAFKPLTLRMLLGYMPVSLSLKHPSPLSRIQLVEFVGVYLDFQLANGADPNVGCGAFEYLVDVWL